MQQPPDSSDPATARRDVGQGVAIVEIDEAAGQRIDNFLLRMLKNVPKSRVYRMLRRGEVRVNGGRKGPTYRLVAGDKVRIPPHHASVRPPVFIGSQRLQQLEQAIIHEDDDLLVLDKPAGVAVHGGSGLSYGVIEALRELRGPGLELAHRLDRDTSGALLLAKRRSALRRIQTSIREGKLTKIYELIVTGRWPADLTSVRLPLLKYHTASGERRVRVAEGGKPSRTDFQLLATTARATLLRANLLTGRTHQIRVHAAASGHPIVGDSKYANASSRSPQPESRLCLHALEVHLPWGQEERSFYCARPADFDAVWSQLSQLDAKSPDSTS